MNAPSPSAGSQELGGHFSRLADMQVKLHTLHRQMEDAQGPGDRVWGRRGGREKADGDVGWTAWLSTHSDSVGP